MQNTTVEYFYVYCADRGGVAPNKFGGHLTRQLTLRDGAATIPLQDLFAHRELPRDITPIVSSYGCAGSLCLRCDQAGSGKRLARRGDAMLFVSILQYSRVQQV
jgi:hypothetical protein